MKRIQCAGSMRKGPQFRCILPEERSRAGFQNVVF